MGKTYNNTTVQSAINLLISFSHYLEGNISRIPMTGLSNVFLFPVGDRIHIVFIDEDVCSHILEAQTYDIDSKKLCQFLNYTLGMVIKDGLSSEYVAHAVRRSIDSRI